MRWQWHPQRYLMVAMEPKPRNCIEGTPILHIWCILRGESSQKLSVTTPVQEDVSVPTALKHAKASRSTKMEARQDSARSQLIWSKQKSKLGPQRSILEEVQASPLDSPGFNDKRQWWQLDRQGW